MTKRQRKKFELIWNEKVALVKKLVEEGVPMNTAKRISGLERLLEKAS